MNYRKMTYEEKGLAWAVLIVLYPIALFLILLAFGVIS